MNNKNKKKFAVEKKIFWDHGGILRTRQFLNAGIHRRKLYAMRDEGIIERISRGLYRLSELPPLSNPDFVAVSLRVPQSVICLISALSYFELTTQISHMVYIALKRGATPPRMTHPPIDISWFPDKAFSEGIEIHKIDDVAVKIYNPEKTLADCFKYRNKIGRDVIIEALKKYRASRLFNLKKLMHYANICKVTKAIQPYIEAML